MEERFPFVFLDVYKRQGVYSIYAGVTAAKAVEVYQLLLDEMQDILKNGLSQEEFNLSLIHI